MIRWLFHPKALILMIVLSFILSLIAIRFSPMNIPIHFSGGQADRFINKYIGLFIFPVLMVIILTLQKLNFKAAWAIYFCVLLHFYLLYHALVF